MYINYIKNKISLKTLSRSSLSFFFVFVARWSHLRKGTADYNKSKNYYRHHHPYVVRVFAAAAATTTASGSTIQFVRKCLSHSSSWVNYIAIAVISFLSKFERPLKKVNVIALSVAPALAKQFHPDKTRFSNSCVTTRGATRHKIFL